MIGTNEKRDLKMGKNVKKEPTTPRRRLSTTRNGAIGKITKVLSCPISSTGQSSVAPTTANIRVVVRVRPSNTREQQDNFHDVIKIVNNQTLVFDPKEEEQAFFYHGVQQKSRDLLKKPKKDVSFAFDRVFNNNSNNVEVFMDSTKNLIDILMDGCNCSVFAYGATGAGKTFTMLGTSEHPGITYLTMRDLFKKKEELSAERDFELMVTYIEVYNELVKDLLNPGQVLNLREDAKYGVMIPGVKGHKINCPEDLFSLLELGNRRRTQHPTDANAESSRSHAVFQVYIQMTLKCTTEIRRAKLSMIDLAGSERGSATGFSGARFKEGANINKSLLALGNCINSLADGHRHVPYRDSKLTRLLKDSLGGNCHTVMIANVSPSSLSFDDTYNTLKYAVRAKKIKSNIKRNVINVDMHADQYIKLVENLQTENGNMKAEIAKYKKEIEELRDQLHEQEQQKHVSTATETVKEFYEAKIEALTKEVEQLKMEYEDLKNKSRRRTFVKDSLSPANKHLLGVLKQSDLSGSWKEDNEALHLSNSELKSANSSFISTTEVDTEATETFKRLTANMKEHMEREFQLQVCELGMSLKRVFKTEVRERLSSLYVDIADKEEMRKKLDEQVERSVRKEDSTTKEIELIQSKKSAINNDLEDLVNKHPRLRHEFQLAMMELDVLNQKYESLLQRKRGEFLMDDHKEKCVIIEKMSKLMKNLFLAAGGKDDAARSIKQEYENLMSAINGKRNLTWNQREDTAVLDSGVSSLTSVQNADDTNRAVKRKIETDSQLSLDSTFVKDLSPKPSSSRPAVQGRVLNNQMVSKGFKPPAAKRLAYAVSPKPKQSPRLRTSPRLRASPRAKENNVKRTVKSETAQLIINARKNVAKVAPSRPRFRN